MRSSVGQLALVPLLAVAIALGATGIHGRRTHEPERAARALAILAPTGDPRLAESEIVTFFESGWVGWDVKTAVEITCGTVRAHYLSDPVRCLVGARAIVFEHECREQRAFQSYTRLAWSALVPALLAVVLGVMQVAAVTRRKRTAA